MNIRKLLFWTHLVAGVVVGVVVGIMCVTGTAIAFEKELVAWAERDLRWADASAGPAMDTDALLTHLHEQRPDVEVSALVFNQDPETVVVAREGRREALYIDPYTGDIREPGSATLRSFMRVMTAWHRWLGAEGEGRAVGKAITGASNLAFLVLLITGLYLWVPKRWSRRALRPALWFVRGAKGKARDWNWHNVLGLWTAPVMLVLIVSAVVISYPWASNLVYQVVGEEPPQGRGGPRGAGGGHRAELTAPVTIELLSYATLLERAQEAVPNWEVISLTVTGMAPRGIGAQQIEGHSPQEQHSGAGAGRGSGNAHRHQAAAGPVSITIQEKDRWPTFSSTQLTLNPISGEIISQTGYADQSTGRQARSWLRFLHTGEAFGFWGKFVAALVSFAGAVLVWTGFAMAIHRLRTWIRRRNREHGLADNTPAP